MRLKIQKQGGKVFLTIDQELEFSNIQDMEKTLSQILKIKDFYSKSSMDFVVAGGLLKK